MLSGPGDEFGIAALQDRCVGRSCWADGVQSDEAARLAPSRIAEVSPGQHRRRVSPNPKREPLVAAEEPVELSFRRAKTSLSAAAPSGRSARLLPARGEGAAMNGRRRHDAPAADKGAEAARQIEAGENRVAGGGDARFVGMMIDPSRRETSTILRTTGARSTSYVSRISSEACPLRTAASFHARLAASFMPPFIPCPANGGMRWAASPARKYASQRAIGRRRGHGRRRQPCARFRTHRRRLFP